MMEKLTEAGKLYLCDYQILTEARKEVERYLNSVVEEVYSIISKETDDLSSNDFRIYLWENQSSKGHLEVQFICSNDNSIFRKSKADIYIIYKDIRNTNLLSPVSSKVFTWSPTVASKLEKILRKSSLEKFGEDLYKPVIIELDINSSTQAADKIAREILKRCNFVINLLQSLNEK